MFTVALGLVLVLAARAAPQEDDYTFFDTLDIEVVNVEVIVIGPGGEPIRDLRLEDFELTEDGKPIEIAIDGCGAPTPRLALAAAARGYAALADPTAAGLDDGRCKATGRVVEAMTVAPRMVAGAGRFTTRLMEVTGGRVLAKEGADGFYAAAVRGPVALGLALKIADGSEACRDGVVLEVLRQLGSLSKEELGELDDFYHRPIRNWNGDQVGELAPDLELQESAASPGTYGTSTRRSVRRSDSA